MISGPFFSPAIPAPRGVPANCAAGDHHYACLRHVCGQYTHNASIRERFGIADGNSSMASRLLKDAEAAKVIRVFDGQAAPKQRRYVPFWV